MRIMHAIRSFSAWWCSAGGWLALWLLAATACGRDEVAGSVDRDGGDRGTRVATVTATPGLVAFWDFVAREPGGQRRLVARVPAKDSPVNGTSAPVFRLMSDS